VVDVPVRLLFVRNDGLVALAKIENGAIATTESDRSAAHDWTHVVPVGLDVMFVRNDGVFAVARPIEGALATTDKGDSAAHDWTHVVAVGQDLLFVRNDGTYAVGNIATGTFVMTDSDSSLAPNWSHVVPVGRNVVFVRDDGIFAVARIDAGSLVTVSTGSGLDPNWTHVVVVGENLMFVRNDGHFAVGSVEGGKLVTTSHGTNAAPNWTHVVAAGEDLLFVRKDGLFAVATIDDDGEFLMTDSGTSLDPNWTHVVAAGADFLFVRDDGLVAVARIEAGKLVTTSRGMTAAPNWTHVVAFAATADDAGAFEPDPSWLSTTRIAPLTGPAGPEPRPLQDTTAWGVLGVDEGVSLFITEPGPHQGRTYIYFGDVNASLGFKRNFDLIAWTSEPRVHATGGHLAQGWTFFLPNSNLQNGPASTQQPGWRYCVKCASLFYCPSGTSAGRCTYDNGLHELSGFEFYLPNREEGAADSSGQPDWHFCGNCNGLCYAPGFARTGSCPAGGTHNPMGWTFVLPNNVQGATDATGQADWRFCAYCNGLFYDGFVHKGTCPAAPGGGLRCTAVLESGTQENGQFFAFQGEPLVEITKSDERPGGAFFWEGRVYVFANVFTAKAEEDRPGDPQYGTYLLSTDTPDQALPLATHYLVSPRIGKCTLANGEVRSHQPLGLSFDTQPGLASSPWRRCQSCAGLFNLVAGNPGRCFGNPAGHSPDGGFFFLSEGAVDTPRHQANWRRCANCLMLFFNGGASRERCPAGGAHDPAGSPSYSMPFSADVASDQDPERGWRYCVQCQGMVFTLQDNAIGGATPYVVSAADFPELPAPPSASGVTFSGQAAVMISHRFGRGPGFPPGFVLACWHLPLGAAPRLQDLLYFDPQARSWSPDVAVLAPGNLFDYAYLGAANDGGYYTETGLLWLPGPRRWMLTYTQAQPRTTDPHALRRPVYARFAQRITDLGGAADIPLFDPTTRPADNALLTDPDSYPYGPYPLEAYTSWDPQARILDLHYLLSFFRPYQVQVMRTQIRIP